MKQNPYTTTDQLKEAISVLTSPSEQMRLLKSLYTPGDAIVVDLMFEISKGEISIELLEKELEFVLGVSNAELIASYGKIIINYYFNNGFSILLPDKLLAWKNEKLIDYALGLLPTMQEKEIEDAITFYQKMKIDNETLRNLLQKSLAFALQNEKPTYQAGSLYVKLGRYVEAVNYYLASKDSHYLDHAWNVAKEHVPVMRGEIAKRVWKLGLSEEAYLPLYVECAQELDLVDDATKKLKKYVAKLKFNSGRYFYSTVEALKMLNLADEIYNVLTLARVHTHSITDFPKDPWSEMAELCLIAGEIDESEEWIKLKLAQEVKQGQCENALKTVSDYEKKRGSTLQELQRMLFPVLEYHQKYDEAAKLAIQLGMNESASRYTQIFTLLKVAKNAA